MRAQEICIGQRKGFVTRTTVFFRPNSTEFSNCRASDDRQPVPYCLSPNARQFDKLIGGNGQAPEEEATGEESDQSQQETKPEEELENALKKLFDR